MKSKQGFTIIELLVVIAVLGILVLLAASSVINHTGDAKVVQIKNDIKAYEESLSAELVSSHSFLSNSPEVNETKLSEINSSGKLLDRRLGSPIVSNVYDVTGLINSKLKGSFLGNENGDVFYYDEKLSLTIDYPETNGSLFEWVESSSYSAYLNKDGKRGYFSYKGKNNNVVNIPNEIDGVKLTSYFRMFANEKSGSVKKVISNNPNLLSTEEMFYGFQSSKLDLTELNVSNVKDMYAMFKDANIENLNVSNMDTRKVSDMTIMFQNATIPTIDLSSFDTSSLRDIGINWNTNPDGTSYGGSSSGPGDGMFSYVNTDKIILGKKFNTQNVTSLSGLFRRAEIGEIVGLENMKNDKVWNMSRMFEETVIGKLDLSKINTPVVTDMYSKFKSVKINELDLSKLDTSNVVNFGDMFMNASIPNLTLHSSTGNRFDTSNVQIMAKMFNNFKTSSVLDVSNFNLSSLKRMDLMFGANRSPKIILMENNSNNPDLIITDLFNASSPTEIDSSRFEYSTIKKENIGKAFQVFSAGNYRLTLTIKATDEPIVTSSDSYSASRISLILAP